MDLSKYNELMAKLSHGDMSVIPEIAAIQDDVLAWKKAQKGKKQEAPKAEQPKEPLDTTDEKKKRKKKED
jgi:hypothetical protein